MQRPQQNAGSPSTPPPGSRLGAPPVLSPAYSRSAFPAVASAAVVVEQRSEVTLDEWWLARVKGNERKIAVGGFFERNEEYREFTAAPISKRYDPCTLETEDGTIVFIYGFFNPEQTRKNGYTIEACEKFSIGFPHWWEEWNVLYPKMMSSQTGSQPSSSTTSNSLKNSNVLSTYTVEYTNEESLVVVDNASRVNKGRQKTLVASLHYKAAPGEVPDEQSSEKGKKLVSSSRKQRSGSTKLQHATRSSNIKREPYFSLTRGMSKSLSVFTPEYLNLKKTRSGRVVVPPLNSGCQNIVYDQHGSISAIVGLGLSPPLKGSTAKNHAKKKKRSN